MQFSRFFHHIGRRIYPQCIIALFCKYCSQDSVAAAQVNYSAALWSRYQISDIFSVVAYEAEIIGIIFRIPIILHNSSANIKDTGHSVVTHSVLLVTVNGTNDTLHRCVADIVAYADTEHILALWIFKMNIADSL